MSNMSKDKKAETKRDPPPISGGDQGRVTAETVVADGPAGMTRLKAMMTRIFTTRAAPRNNG